MGLKATIYDFGPAFGKPNSSARKMWQKLVSGDVVDSSFDREGMRALVIAIGKTSNFGRWLNNKFNLGVR